MNAGPYGKHAGVRYDYIPANTPSVLNAADSGNTDDDTAYLSLQLTQLRIKRQARGVTLFKLYFQPSTTLIIMLIIIYITWNTYHVFTKFSYYSHPWLPVGLR